MPCGSGCEKNVTFFTLGRRVSDDELEKEYKLRGLKVDPYAQAKANQEDPTFADTHPNACHWKDEDGKWCFVAFGQWGGDERLVRVGRDGGEWSDGWLFAGVPE